MWIRTLALLTLLLGIACTPQSGNVGSVVSREAGLSGHYSPQMPISDDAHHVLMGHVIDAHQDGTRVRALVIGVRRDGVHRLRLTEVWSRGVALPFAATHRRSNGCTHGHCRDAALGMIFLSDALFAHALQNGLVARLHTNSGPIDIAAPAALFQALPQSPVAPPS